MKVRFAFHLKIKCLESEGKRWRGTELQLEVPSEVTDGQGGHVFFFFFETKVNKEQLYRDAESLIMQGLVLSSTVKLL